MVKAFDRRTGHQKGFQDAVVYGGDALAGNAFIVVVVPAVQVDPLHFAHRGVEHHREKAGKNRCAKAFGKRLAFGFVFLAVAFDAMTEYLVKENTRGAPGKDCRSKKWLGDGRMQESREVARHPVDGGQDGVVTGKA